MNFDLGLDTRMTQMSGIGTYLRGLLSGFNQSPFFESHRVKLCGGDPKILSGLKASWRPFFAPIYSITEQLEYPSRTGECAVWHSPHYNIPLLHGRAKLVTTIHDIIHWIYRRQFFNRVQTAYAGFMLSQAVRRSDHIIAVSRHTKEDLVRHFGADPGKISVIHEAVDPKTSRVTDSAAIETVRQKYGLPKNYFLYVGLVKPHKNLLWLKSVFKKLKNERRLQACLVIAGKKDRSYPKGYEALASIEDDKTVYHLEGATREELLCLYSGAIALVHPSLYEGFGLTLLEAMACETPVIALDTASISEVAGEGACLIRPGDERAMAEALVRTESDPVYAKTLAGKGRERVKAFSWQKTASETAAIYERLLHG